jgi:hypothetical protein
LGGQKTLPALFFFGLQTIPQQAGVPVHLFK